MKPYDQYDQSFHDENGYLHRLDGPAVTWPNGAKFWYFHGDLMYCVSQEEFEIKLRLRAFW